MSIYMGNKYFREGNYKAALAEYEKLPSNDLLKYVEYNKKKCLQLLNGVDHRNNYIKYPLLSIIVPTYNVENFLEEALNSLVNQSLKEIEIIIINDGSTDKSAEIAENFSKIDSRIRIYSLNKNRGYGHACNLGLRVARGKYTVIFEPDDYVDRDCYELSCKTAIENDVEVVFFGWRDIIEGKPSESPYIRNLKSNNIPLGAVIDLKDYPRQINTQPAVWSFIIKRDFYLKENIAFLETPGASFQDISFYNKIAVKSSKVLYLNKIFYNYRHHASQSVASKDKPLPILEYKELVNDINSVLNSRISENKKDKVLYNITNRLFSSARFHVNKRADIQSVRSSYADLQAIVDDICSIGDLKEIIKVLRRNDDFVSSLIDFYHFNDFLSVLSEKSNLLVQKTNKVKKKLTICLTEHTFKDDFKKLKQIKEGGADWLDYLIIGNKKYCQSVLENIDSKKNEINYRFVEVEDDTAINCFEKVQTNLDSRYVVFPKSTSFLAWKGIKEVIVKDNDGCDIIELSGNDVLNKKYPIILNIGKDLCKDSLLLLKENGVKIGDFHTKIFNIDLIKRIPSKYGIFLGDSILSCKLFSECGLYKKISNSCEDNYVVNELKNNFLAKEKISLYKLLKRNFLLKGKYDFGVLAFGIIDEQLDFEKYISEQMKSDDLIRYCLDKL